MLPFTMNDVFDEEAGSGISLFLDAPVEQLFVEFLQQDSIKPHVVFKLNFGTQIEAGGEDYVGCRLSMEYTGDPGDFEIKPVAYMESSHAAAASFQFQVRSAGKVPLRHWIYTFCGDRNSQDYRLRGNLTHFTFVEVNQATRELDGCRDFM